MDKQQYNQIIETHFSLLKQIHSDNQGWKQDYQKGNTTIFTRKYENQAINLVKVHSEVPVNIQKCVKFYHFDAQGQHDSRENNDFLNNLEQIDENTYVCHFQIRGKFMVSSREFLQVQQVRKIDEDTYFIIKPELKEHTKFKPTKGSVRGEIIIQGVVLKKVDENKTIVDQYMLFDPKGNIPTSLVNMTVQLELGVQEKAEQIMKGY